MAPRAGAHASTRTPPTPRRSTGSRRWRAARASSRRSSPRTPSRTCMRDRADAAARRGGARQPLGPRRQGRGQRGRGAAMSRLADDLRARQGRRPARTRDLRHGRRPDAASAPPGFCARSIAPARLSSRSGVPFSDPLADGPVIQRATERALASGTTLARRARSDRARCARRIRAGIVIFSYANPIMRLGAERFADRAKAAGVDGVLVLDLPLEEAATSARCSRRGALIQSCCSARPRPTSGCGRPRPSAAVSSMPFPVSA